MLRLVAAAIAAALVLAIAATLAIPYVVDTPRVQALISHSITQALGRPARFASLGVSVFPLPAVRLRDLEVSEDPSFGMKPFLTIGTGSFRLRVWPLFWGRVEFSELVLEKPKVALIRDRNGRMNVATLGTQVSAASAARSGAARAAGAAAVPVVSRIRVVDAEVTFTSHSPSSPGEYVLRDLDLTVQGIGPTSPLQFSGDAALHPGDLRVKLLDGSLAVTAGRSLLDAPLRARLQVGGADVGSLAAPALGSSAQVGGPIKGAFLVSGTPGAPAVAGEVELATLTVSRAEPACRDRRRRVLTLDGVRLPVSFARDVLTSEPFSARLAGGTITAGVTLGLRDGAGLQVRGLTIRAFPLAPVLVDFLCQDYAISGALDLTGELAARTGDLLGTLSGAGRLTVGSGKVVGPRALKLLAGVMRVGGAVAALLSADVPASLVESPLDFDSVTASWMIRDGVFSTGDLRYSSRPMQISAAGRYRLADGQVDVDLTMRSGRGEIGARVTGTAASPMVRVDPGVLVQRRGVTRGARDLEQGVRNLLKRLR